MELDDHLKQLIRDLGVAINDALSDSSDVGDAIETVREAGYEVFLVLEATIGVHRRGGDAPGKNPGHRRGRGQGRGDEMQLRVSDQDLKFLKSLRIRVDDPDAR